MCSDLCLHADSTENIYSKNLKFSNLIQKYVHNPTKGKPVAYNYEVYS